MDRMTYNLLSQRLDYLELLTNIHAKNDSRKTTSYITQLSALNNNLNKFIADQYPELLRMIELLKQYNLWDNINSIAQLDKQPSKETKLSSDRTQINSKKHLLLSNYQYLTELIDNIQKLKHLDTHDILAKRFPTDIIKSKHVIGNLNQMLVNQILPEEYNKLIVSSISFMEAYITMIHEYNSQFSRLKDRLVEANRQVIRRNFELKRQKADNKY